MRSSALGSGLTLSGTMNNSSIVTDRKAENVSADVGINVEVGSKSVS